MNMSLTRDGSGEVMEKPSARKAGGLPWQSVQIRSSCRMRLCKRPCVQLKKCALACTLSDASRFSTIDSICRKSACDEPSSCAEPCAAAAEPEPEPMILTGGDGMVSVVCMERLCLESCLDPGGFS